MKDLKAPLVETPPGRYSLPYSSLLICWGSHYYKTVLRAHGVVTCIARKCESWNVPWPVALAALLEEVHKRASLVSYEGA